MHFEISGLDPAPFAPLYGLPDAELAAHGVLRRLVDSEPGYPDRVTLRDAPRGATVLLLNHTHLPQDSPYRASHAIYVLEGARQACVLRDEIPPCLRPRMLSLRAFDADHLMVQAELAAGDAVKAPLRALLALPEVAYVHLHYAKAGCFAARAQRVE